MDAYERKLLDETLLGLAEDQRYDDLTVSLDQFGWRDVLAAEPRAAITSLFGAQGRTGRWSSALQDVLALGIDTIGVGGPTNVLLPRPNRSVAATELRDGITVDGVLLAPRDSSILTVLVESSGAGKQAVAVDPDDLVMTLRFGLDPGLGVREVTGYAHESTVLAEGVTADLWWEQTQARARLAICHQVVASLFVMIELARSHVSEREQFGRLVGTFQAVRHKLVEAHVAATAADSCTETAWESADLPLASATAKLATGKAVAVVSAHTQQLLAGLGFTAEHPFHRFMKRVLVLERLLGSSTELASELGGQLLERGEAPRLVEL
jgi:hypothetical protein